LGEGSLFSSLLRMIASLVVVFGALFALRFYVLRKVPTTKAQGLLRLRERIPLGPRSQAVILDVADKSYLVCMSEHAINLTELPQLTAADSQGNELPPFSSQLRDALTILKGRD